MLVLPLILPRLDGKSRNSDVAYVLELHRGRVPSTRALAYRIGHRPQNRRLKESTAVRSADGCGRISRDSGLFRARD